MISPFNLRGYDGFDPLDYIAPRPRLLLAIGVTAIVATLLVYCIAVVFPVIEFIGLWFMIVEAAGFALLAAPVVLWLRKSSSFVIYFVIFLPLFLADLYMQAHIRDHGMPALWDYPEGTFITLITILPLRFFLTISTDALLIGPLCLWLTRLAALLFYNKTAAQQAPTREQRSKLFREEWTTERVDKPKRDAGYWILRLLGFGYLSYLLLLGLGALGASSWPEQIRFLMDMTYRNPVFAISTFSKIGFMVVLAFIGAYNVRIRWHATLALAIGHGVSIAVSMLFYFLNSPGYEYRAFLLTSAIVDGVMVALFIWIIIVSARVKFPFKEEKEFPGIFSVPAMIARRLFFVLAALSGLIMAFILLIRFSGWGGEALALLFSGPDPTLGNTVTMYSVILLLSLLLARRERLRHYFTGVMLFGLFLTVIPGTAWLLIADVCVETSPGNCVPVLPYFVAAVLLAATIAAVVMAVRKMYYNVEYAINTFSPSSARNIMALHDALFEDEEQHGEVLQSIDKYVSSMRGRKRGLLNFPFWLIENLFSALFGLHPTFSTMSPAEQKYFFRKYMIRPPSERAKAFVPIIADMANTMGAAAHAMILFASYSNLKKQHRIKYVPPGARDRLQGQFASTPPPFKEVAPLPVDENDPANYQPVNPAAPHPFVAPRVVTPANELPIPEEVDYLVVGSGPGGAVMAYRLACEADRSQILIVERGGRYSPLQDMNDREIEMMPKFYKEGGLQQTKRADMFVLQGECVGGGSVIYNAVCYEMPQTVQETWREKFDLPVEKLAAEYALTARELGIQPLPETGINQVVKQKFLAGVNAHNAKRSADEQLLFPPAVLVNAANAAGDGLWNIGNKYMRKRSMLETYIPWAESAGKDGKGSGLEPPGARVVSNTTAVRFVSEGKRASAVILRTASGDLRTVRIRKAVIVAGGVIASSHFLLRSEVKGNVGRGMSCNFAFPVVLEFAEEIKAFDGEQITMGALDPKNRAIFETYFNPPSAFSLTVPFFFDRHRNLMLKYSNVLNFGALMGSEANGVVERKADIINGRAFTWELGERDREHIRYTLSTLLEIGLGAGARKAIVPTLPGIELDLSPANVEQFRKAMAGYPLTARDLLLTTAHPQGGNLMAGSGAAPEIKEQRVVDERFRAAGLDNVFVADASVFPGSLTINPQWTIMAMSSLASRSVLELCE